MNTLTLPATACHAAPLGRLGRPEAAPARLPIDAVPAVAPRRGWIERLAIWADRQPRHRRLGSWTLA